MSKVLITGDRGYIGSTLSKFLMEKKIQICGYDLGLYDDYYVTSHNVSYKSSNGDVRSISLQDFRDIDAVVWLAALSNDPLGEFNSSITMDINNYAVVRGRGEGTVLFHDQPRRRKCFLRRFRREIRASVVVSKSRYTRLNR